MDKTLEVFRQYFLLATLIVVLISLLASYYFFEIFLINRASHIATYMIQGLTLNEARFFIWILVMLMLLCAAALALTITFLCSLLLPALQMVIWNHVLEVPYHLLRPLLSVWGLSSIAMSAPLIVRLWRLSPIYLLESSHSSFPIVKGRELALAHLIPFLSFLFMAGFLLKSWKSAFLFAA